MGRMLLAHLNPEEWPRSPRVRKLAAELADLSSAGHSLTVDQTPTRTQTLVWPVLGMDGSAVAVLALEGPQFQFDASAANIRRLIELSVPLAEQVRSDPRLATNPFAHVPDRDIKLRVGG
jgi:DNA-binding IclR family transcriptional regulator